ncbi:MAG: type 4a pilus biogenesis protein PilO [Halomonas subglaciescola]|nr:type 4a pilus biogenesis protein PilO [Halomonas subglaciescola]
MRFSREGLAKEWRQLKRVDWQGLEFREAGSWPVLLKALSCALVLTVAFTAMCWFVVNKHSNALDDAQEEEQQLLEAFEQKSIKAAYLPRMEKQMNMLNEQMKDVRKMLPTTVEIPSLLDSINDAAVENHLKTDHIRSQPAVDNEYYIEHPFAIQVRGSYHQIAGFVAEMAALPRIVTQHDFTLEPLEHSGGLLSLSMQARTYSYQETTPGEQP